MQNIIETAKAAPNFKTLCAALVAGKLVDTLNGPGPFTVFAPTDEAFAKVPKAQMDALLADPIQLKKVLSYHVVSGKVMAADVSRMKDGDKVKTVEGHDLSVHLDRGTVKLNNATVTRTDIATSNGVIHAVDTVLMPG